MIDALMTLDDARTELQQLQTKIKNKRSEKEKKEEIRNKKREELAKLKEKKNKVKEEKLRITAELQNRDGLEQQKKEKEATVKELIASIQDLDQSLPGFENEIKKAEKGKAACHHRREDALKKLREEKTALDKQKDSIVDLHRKIQEFENKKGRFALIQQKVSDCKENLRLCEEHKEEIAKQIQTLKKEIANQEVISVVVAIFCVCI